MGYCYRCKAWKQNGGTLEQQFFGECTDPHFMHMNEAHGLKNIDQAGFIGPNREGVKFITGKKFGCIHYTYIPKREREGFVPRPPIKHEFLKMVLTNSKIGTTHTVRTKAGELNHNQVYNARRMLCWETKCPECDPAGCFPEQVILVHEGIRARGNVYQINQKNIAEAVSRRE